MTAPEAVACRGLVKRFGPVVALDGASFDVRRGEILTLLGPSGCGKTTALRVVAGLERPDGGTVEIDGAPVAGDGVWVPPERRRVGLVFQHYALFPHLTVIDNVAYGLGRSRDRAARAAEVLRAVGLAGFEDRMPHMLSGGQQQRVALARALAPRPAVLLLDEPFSNLDARLRLAVREEVRDVILATGTSAVFVTHDQEEALFMGDRVAILDAGRVVQVDTPEAVFHAPRTRFVAEFLGHTHFLPAEVTPTGMRTELGCVGQAVPLPPGTPVELLVRPDDLELTPLAQDADGLGPALPYDGARDADRTEHAARRDGAWPSRAGGVVGHVARRTFQGMHNLYRVTLPSGRAVDCLAPHALVLPAGAPVRVAVSPGHALVCFAEGVAV